MLWLLAAEFRKLIRPLVWGTALAIIGFCLLITWGGVNNARGALASPRIPDVCARAVSAQCRQVVAHAHAAARTAASATSLLAQPGQIGHVAAGMLASVPGLLLIALVAGGHWGGEWGSGTIRQLLSRQGRRTQVLVAKWVTIWAAGMATMVCCWLVLAVTAPVIAAVAHHADGDADSAAADLAAALTGGVPAGYCRLFLDEGPPVAELLGQIARAAAHEARTHAEHLLAAARRPSAHAPAGPASEEGLSERELEVLRLLATDLTGPRSPAGCSCPSTPSAHTPGISSPSST
jgi:MalT-like TPR region/ABC-2 family transporter protein